MADGAAVAEGEAFYRRLALHSGLRYALLDPSPGQPEPVDRRAAILLAGYAARQLGVLPIGFEGEVLVVAVPDPGAIEALAGVEQLTSRRVVAALASPEGIGRAHERIYRAATEAPPVGPRLHDETVRIRRRPTAGERRRYRELAAHAGLEFVSLEPLVDSDGSELDPVNPTAAQMLSATVCRRFRMLPISARRGTVTLAVADPSDPLGARVAFALTGSTPRVVIAPPSEVDRAIDRIFGALPGTVEEPEPQPWPVVAAAVAPASGFQRLGELLVDTGMVTRAQVGEALALQTRTGIKLGEALLHSGAIDERNLARALAEQLRLPDIDVSSFEPDRGALALVPEPIARQYRFVPLAIRDHRLVLAMSDPLDDDVIRELRKLTDLPIQTVVTSRTAVDRLLQRVYGPRYVRIATTELLNRSPEESAYRVLSPPQKLVFGAIAFLSVVALAYDPVGAIVAFNLASIAFYTAFSLYKFSLMYRAISHELELPVDDDELASLDERTLPVYTILVPLYREAAVVHKLVAAIAHLDYPRPKLDVKLLVEEDDDETLTALRALRLPPHFKLVVVPDAQPKTKPKACNYGLIHAEGKYVVIYDAEDQPERDQLKKVIVAFSKAERRIVCIQCKLNYYNRNQNLLTRWFTSEYSNWFDLLMPGLDATDAPIPLGGTSNHFLTEALIELGAWDPYNVTEDADLGVRLHKAGYKTAIIDSTTYEEANSDLYNWIRQRSRWVKGYIQTWLVHMRHPVQLLHELGWRGFFSFQFIIAGTFFSFLLNPVYWALTTLWLMTSAGIIRELFPSFIYYAAAVGLYVGNFVFTYVNVVGAMRRRYFSLVKYTLLSPLYWALMSVGAWKGLIQLLYRPYYWEKTVHGLDLPDPEELVVVRGS
jgi:cellulose synthase/poly-beta-1,6-N-acetylglucosamine synthase-like glycosyltransferase